MKTAEEFSRNFTTGKDSETTQEYISSMLIEFAKLHVEAAKKEFHKIALQEGLVTEAGIAYFENAYPLELIK